ncbi:methyltransferase domain-containing protein [Phenylobacterium sp.]|uniref:class I SAM-dependent methyltransferase n=1 Tax=Phenylobacterium sp. TaxID=1871053 RepID=UPI00286C2389|nr:methyltransferase domain-containing protein [Phenylobacterium sp.]
MQNPAPNLDQMTYWNQAAAPAWVELNTDLDRQIAPLGAAALAALAPRSGERILDIGCGCGQSALALAEAVGATGRVVGVDISAPMLAVARRRAEAAAASHLRFLEADAQVHPFEPGAADAAYSRFGVMFFEDPAAAFANIRKALRSGGRIAFLCWRALTENPWMTVPMSAGLKHLPPRPPPVPDAPGPFAFADGERLHGLLSAAGFADIEVKAHDQKIRNDPAATFRTAMRVGPLGAMLREAPEARERVEADVRAAILEHLENGQVTMDSATWIVTARSP